MFSNHRVVGVVGLISYQKLIHYEVGVTLRVWIDVCAALLFFLLTTHNMAMSSFMLRPSLTCNVNVLGKGQEDLKMQRTPHRKTWSMHQGPLIKG